MTEVLYFMLTPKFINIYANIDCVCVREKERDEDCKLVTLALKIFTAKISEAMHFGRNSKPGYGKPHEGV